ncbi:MAG TPA: hypothetical protein VK737_07035 [Opitutales bacterium]|nr:hypothetical protein [Opitutales bacterium]
MDNPSDTRAGWAAKAEPGGDGPDDGIFGVAGFWSQFDIIPCRDGKARRIPEPESVLQPLVDGFPGGMGALRDSFSHASEEEKEIIMNAIASFPLAGKVPGRVPLLKGAGNAINPVLAAEFIKAVMESL